MRVQHTHLIKHTHLVKAIMRGVLVVSTVSNWMAGSAGRRREGEELGETHIAVNLASIGQGGRRRGEVGVMLWVQGVWMGGLKWRT
jgi:hypothetical protein